MAHSQTQGYGPSSGRDYENGADIEDSTARASRAIAGAIAAGPSGLQEDGGPSGQGMQRVSWKIKGGDTFNTQSTGEKVDLASMRRAPELDAGFGFPRPDGGSVQAYVQANGNVGYLVSGGGQSEFFDPNRYGAGGLTDSSYDASEARRLSNYPASGAGAMEPGVQRVEIVGRRMTFAESTAYDAQQLAAERLPPYLDYVGQQPLLSELIGAQSLPGTVDAMKNVVQGGVIAAHGGWASGATANGSRTVGPIRAGTQPVIVINTNPKPGMPMVMALPAAPAPSLFTQVGSAATSAARNAPGLSLAGTALEYQLYGMAGQSQAARKTWGTDFAVDAALDIQKGIVAGSFGAATGAVVGAWVGSSFPVVGTAAGALVGLGAGTIYAWMVERAYTEADTRNYFKDLAKDNK